MQGLIEKIKAEIKNTKDKNKEYKSKIFDEIYEYDFLQQHLHSIRNLTLIDAGTNSSLGNNIFSAKRAAIIEKIKSNNYKGNDGFFLLPSTEKVFMKAYTKFYENDENHGKSENSNPENFNFWTVDDEDAYLEVIQNVLNSYIGVGQ